MLGDLKRLKVLEHEHLAGINGGHDRVGTHDWFLACGVSVVVDDLDPLGSSVRPTEADTPLLIDADAVGASPIALELLEPVSRRHPQIIECLGSIQDEQLPQRRALGALVELAHPLSSPEPAPRAISRKAPTAGA